MIDDCTTVREVKKSGATTAVSTRHKSEIADIVAKAAGGDFEAFGDLYSIFLDPIYRYIFYQINDRMKAEDFLTLSVQAIGTGANRRGMV